MILLIEINEIFRKYIAITDGEFCTFFFDKKTNKWEDKMNKYSDNTIKDVLKGIEKGRTVLPAMQRSFVWPEEKFIICSTAL